LNGGSSLGITTRKAIATADPFGNDSQKSKGKDKGGFFLSLLDNLGEDGYAFLDRLS
jgi:hypothetical protein